MTPHQLPYQQQTLPVSHEIFPDFPGDAGELPVPWLEIALHLEVEERSPAGHPKANQEIALLMDLANRLIQRAATYGPCEAETSAAYYSLLPSASGFPAPPKLARSVSLVFTGIECQSPFAEPAILTILRRELAQLGIPRAQRLQDLAPEAELASVSN